VQARQHRLVPCEPAHANQYRLVLRRRGLRGARASARALALTGTGRCCAQARLAAATELIGERDETLEELRADLVDIKSMYKDQIEYMVLQLATAQPRPSPPVPAPHQAEGAGDTPPLPVSSSSTS
jgi:hypothetical protein